MAMRVLLTNNTLSAPAGTELYVRDVALELARRGHTPVAYSTRLGVVAEQLRQAGIQVVDQLGQVGIAPDVIHGHHHYETQTALLYFPHAPAISFSHGPLPWQEAAAISPGVARYVAMSELSRRRLIEEGVAPERIERLNNFFDARRFPARPALPKVPRRALAFGHSYTESFELPVLREACQRLGIELDALGHGNGNEDLNPGSRLCGYDIVFARARSAIEAMAVGAAVILSGYGKLGPLVERANFDELRRHNFGLHVIDMPLDVELLVAQLQHYNAGETTRLTEHVRRECELGPAVDRLIELYEDVLVGAARGPATRAEDVARAAGRYLETWSSRYKLGPEGSGFQAGAADAASRRTISMSQEKLAATEPEMAGIGKSRVGEGATERELARTVWVLETRLAGAEHELQLMRNSATWRWSRRVLGHPLVNTLFGRALRRLAGKPRPRIGDPD
jgi:hypothetical protein